VGFTTLVIGVFYIPISIAAVIFGATPFWTALFGYLLMRQEVQRIDVICMIGCFFGVAFLALSKKGEDIESEEADESSSQNYAIGVTCIVITSVCWSLANILTRLIKNVHFSLVMFHYGWLASTILLLYLGAEHCFINETPFATKMRFMTYDFE